jgi:hypothetical protein
LNHTGSERCWLEENISELNDAHGIARFNAGREDKEERRQEPEDRIEKVKGGGKKNKAITKTRRDENPDERQNERLINGYFPFSVSSLRGGVPYGTESSRRPIFLCSAIPSSTADF